MKYTKEERLDIGRRIYDGELTRYQAAEYYDINEQTARSYIRLYRQTNHLPPKSQGRRSGGTTLDCQTLAEFKKAYSLYNCPNNG